MSEADEQQAVVEWCDLKGVPIFHIPNGGFRHPAEAKHLKAQGVKAGVPDLCVNKAKYSRSASTIYRIRQLVTEICQMCMICHNSRYLRPGVLQTPKAI